MKKMIKSTLGNFGYAITDKGSLRPKDLREKIHNPLFAKYFARKHDFLINADFKNCIMLNRFSCENTGNNPLVNTVTDYLENKNISYTGSELEHFFDTCTPKNVAEMFSLKGKLHGDLIELPAMYWVVPWENADMKSKKKFREQYVKRENEQRGRELSLAHGWSSIGPISKALGKLEINTLIGLTKSIIANGYLRGNGYEADIKATLLVNGSDYKYLIYDGTHRIAVLSALKYKSAPLRVLPKSIPAFVYRSEVDFWPKVKSGLYTRGQALQIFDSFFKADGNKVG